MPLDCIVLCQRLIPSIDGRTINQKTGRSQAQNPGPNNKPQDTDINYYFS
jgi:hypothetical protein